MPNNKYANIMDPDTEKSPWKARSAAVRKKTRYKHKKGGYLNGSRKLYPTPKDFLHAAFEYFAWCEKNPVMKQIHAYDKETKTYVKDEEPSPRLATLAGLTGYLGIGRMTWYSYKKREEFAEACDYIESAMENQRAVGAASGTMNPQFISRYMGLAEHKVVDSKVLLEEKKVDLTPLSTEALKELADLDID